MANVIKVKLTPSGIKVAREELKKYRESLPKRAEKAIRELVEMGYEYALQQLNDTHYDITKPKISTEVFKSENKIVGRIYVLDDEMKWIEFGTGVRGSENPHPKAEEFNWTYNPSTKYSKKTGRPYSSPYTGAIEGGWWYINEKKGLSYTTGIPSNPIMYNTKLYIQEHWREVFDKYMKGEYTE